MNKPPLIPNSYLISFLLNLTHTSCEDVDDRNENSGACNYYLEPFL
jgi:hypothetical protein